MSSPTSSSSAEKVQVIKVVWDKDVRRFQLPPNATYEVLQTIIKGTFKLEKDFSVKYIDNEGDIVTIANNADLQEACRIHINSVLKIQLDVPMYPEVAEKPEPAKVEPQRKMEPQGISTVQTTSQGQQTPNHQSSEGQHTPVPATPEPAAQQPQSPAASKPAVQQPQPGSDSTQQPQSSPAWNGNCQAWCEGFFPGRKWQRWQRRHGSCGSFKERNGQQGFCQRGGCFSPLLLFFLLPALPCLLKTAFCFLKFIFFIPFIFAFGFPLFLPVLLCLVYPLLNRTGNFRCPFVAPTANCQPQPAQPQSQPQQQPQPKPKPSAPEVESTGSQAKVNTDSPSYSEQQQLLKALGFVDENLNLQLLQIYKGDVRAVSQCLFGQ